MRKAVFIDLQGTLGGNGIGDIRDFEFYNYSIKALNLFKTKGYLVFVVTNQSRIGKGLFTYDEYLYHQQRIFKDVSVDGIEC